MRIAAFQFDVRRGDVPGNLERVELALRRAADRGVELVLLPEMWSTSFLAVEEIESSLGASDEALERLRRLSKEFGLAVAGSSYGRCAQGLPHNTLRLFEGGELVYSYRKVHLFSPTGEHKAFSRGQARPTSISWRGWKLSAGICYDLRFPGLWRPAFVDEAELILVCAQWPVMRIAHWETLLRGRAVEHQAFFLGANRTGVELLGRKQKELLFPGHSMLVSPHGEVLARAGDQEELLVAEIDRGSMLELRRTLPLRKDEALGQGLGPAGTELLA